MQSIAEGGARPTLETLDFAMIVAEAYHMDVTTARYLTDLVDKNVKGEPWSAAGLKPVEQMTATISETGADDCEGFAAGLASRMYGTVHGQECDNLLYNATRAILRCWLPIVSLGLTVRSGGEGAQYKTVCVCSDFKELHPLPTQIPRTAGGRHERARVSRMHTDIGRSHSDGCQFARKCVCGPGHQGVSLCLRITRFGVALLTHHSVCDVLVIPHAGDAGSMGVRHTDARCRRDNCK